MIQNNPKNSGKLVHSLMELEGLRDIRKQVEITSAEIMARIDKLVKDVPEPPAPNVPN